MALAPKHVEYSVRMHDEAWIVSLTGMKNIYRAGMPNGQA